MNGELIVLTLTFLGVGSAFAKRNYQSNALVEAWSESPERQDAPDDNLLIDFGSTGPLALYQLKDLAGFSYLVRNGAIYYPAIRRVFITHVHQDHIGGIEEFAILNRRSRLYQDSSVEKPLLLGAPGVLDLLWENCLKGGLGVMANRRVALDDYFRVVRLGGASAGNDGKFTLLDRYELSIFPTDHVRLNEKYDWPSYGLVIHDLQSGESVVYSGDTRFDPESLIPKAEHARLIFHDVQLEPEPDSVHALLGELRTWPEPLRRKMVLYHFSDGWEDPKYRVVKAEFAGFAFPQRRVVLFGSSPHPSGPNRVV
ncbi:MAG: MBL fold metallo-hydrolase [Planctomycetota bacterium]